MYNKTDLWRRLQLAASPITGNKIIVMNSLASLQWRRPNKVQGYARRLTWVVLVAFNNRNVTANHFTCLHHRTSLYSLNSQGRKQTLYSNSAHIDFLKHLSLWRRKQPSFSARWRWRWRTAMHHLSYRCNPICMHCHMRKSWWQWPDQICTHLLPFQNLCTKHLFLGAQKQWRETFQIKPFDALSKWSTSVHCRANISRNYRQLIGKWRTHQTHEKTQKPKHILGWHRAQEFFRYMCLWKQKLPR